MQHGQKVHSQPIDLLSKNKKSKSWKYPMDICAVDLPVLIILLQNEIAEELLKEKIKNIESLNPDAISTGNIGCITQISNGTKIPILHTIEIVGLVYWWS